MIFHLYLGFLIDHLYHLYFQSRSQRNIEQQCTRTSQKCQIEHLQQICFQGSYWSCCNFVSHNNHCDWKTGSCCAMMISPTVLTWSLIAEMSAARLPACQPSKPWKLLNAWSTLLLQAFPFLLETQEKIALKIKFVLYLMSFGYFTVLWRLGRW